jgi:hypothetical protein
MLPFGRGTAKIVKFEGTFSCVQSQIPLWRARTKPGEKCTVQFCWTSMTCVNTNCASELFVIAQNSVKNAVGSSEVVSPSVEEAKRTIF